MHKKSWWSRLGRSWFWFVAAALCGGAWISAEAGQGDDTHGMSASSMRDAYDRAARFIPISGKPPIVRNATLTPNWIDARRFWYRRDVAEGHEFVLVDIARAASKLAFDHGRMSEVLTVALGRPIAARGLPIDELEFEAAGGPGWLNFSADERRWRCSLRDYRCSSHSVAPLDVAASPDGSLHVFRRDHNLWVRDVATGHESALTTDGERFNEYGWYSGNSQSYVTSELQRRPPLVLFSPDSRKVAVERVDERDVDSITLWQGGPKDSTRPKVHEMRLSFAGDARIARRTLVVFDLAKGTRHDIDQSLERPGAVGSASEKLMDGLVTWCADSRRLYFFSTDRYFKTLRLSVFDLGGEAKTLIEETSATQINLMNSHESVFRPATRILASGDILWYSERSGWGHFYRYDSNGNLKGALTQGEWVAYEIPSVDEKRGFAYVVGAGREPGRDVYYRQVYQVPLAGGEPRLISQENADHAVAFAPDGSHFVDTYSSIDSVPISVLKTAAGKRVAVLETADIDTVLPQPWTNRPEVFKVKARDGKTDIYGELFKPSNFDPRRRYPVLDHVYSSPYQLSAAFPAFSPRWLLSQAFAELGFIVVKVHGFGAPGRSKAFQDYSYGNLQDAGMPDHVAALTQLAERTGYMDLSRVGIFGNSTGGYNAILGMMDFPDFYKVGYAGVPGVDHPHLLGVLVERYQGPPVDGRANYAPLELANRVGELKGKLLLAFSDMDENVPMHTIARFLDAMKQANKDYDLIYLTNESHRVTLAPYALRRTWDHFVRHLLGAEPPTEYPLGH